MAVRMFRYRIYPSEKQRKRLIASFISCKGVYNLLLSISKDAYAVGKVSLNKFDFNSIVKGHSDAVYSQVLQNVSDRVHKAMQNFFRRVKDKSYKKKGFPRYKSRVNSITYPQGGFSFLSNRHIKVSKIGNLSIILHRLPREKIKTLTLKQTKSGKWFATFCCEMPDAPVLHPHTNAKVGIDVGLENFVTLSDGEVISNPHHLLRSEARLKLLHRRVSRKKKGSANRMKARLRLSLLYEKVSNQRSDFLHKLSHSLTQRYGSIAVEQLNIKGMVCNHHLAKHISDASWSSFIRMLEYKAVTSGSSMVKVDARMTSQICSRCGQRNKITLAVREFVCTKCGFACHRDLNASLNISSRAGHALTHTPVEMHPSTAEQSAASVIVEAGTIHGLS